MVVVLFPSSTSCFGLYNKNVSRQDRCVEIDFWFDKTHSTGRWRRTTRVGGGVVRYYLHQKKRDDDVVVSSPMVGAVVLAWW